MTLYTCHYISAAPAECCNDTKCHMIENQVCVCRLRAIKLYKRRSGTMCGRISVGVLAWPVIMRRRFLTIRPVTCGNVRYGMSGASDRRRLERSKEAVYRSQSL